MEKIGKGYGMTTMGGEGDEMVGGAARGGLSPTPTAGLGRRAWRLARAAADAMRRGGNGRPGCGARRAEGAG